MPLVPLLRDLLGREPGLTVGVEVFSEELKALTPQEAAARVASSTSQVLKEVRGGLVPSP